MRPLSLLAALAALGAPLLAQDPQGQPRFGTDLGLVMVDVVVSDDKGAPVRGLRIEDFAVYDDGAPQPVTAFEAIDRSQDVGRVEPPSGPSTLTVQAEDSGERATVVVVFDEPHLTATAVEVVRRQLVEVWANGGLGRADVLLAGSGGGGTWRGRLPEDASDLSAALRRFRGSRPPSRESGRMNDVEAFQIAARGDDNTLIQVYRRYIENRLLVDPTIPSLQPRTRDQRSDAQQNVPAIGRAAVKAEAEQRWQEIRTRRDSTLLMLSRLLTGLAERRGRKAVLLVSEGFINEPGLPRNRELLEAARRARTAIYVVDSRDSGPPSTHAAESLDPVDSRDQADTFARAARSAEGAEGLALDTGGRILRSRPNLTAAMARLGAELRTYYVLGYAAPDGGRDGRYHKLAVKLPRHPGMRLDARPGYHAIDIVDHRPQKTPPAAVVEVLESPFDATGLPLQLAAYVLATDREGKTAVRVVAELDAAAFASRGGSATVDAVVQIAARERSEALRWSTAAAVPSGEPRIRLETQFQVPAGTYQVRVAARERGSNAQRSALQAVEVPPAGAFRTSTPVLTDLLGGEPPVPMLRAERRFHAGSKLYCHLEVFGASTRGVVNAGLELRGADGSVRFAVPPSPMAAARKSRVWSIPTRELQAGVYELVLSVQDEATGESLKRRERFEIVS